MAALTYFVALRFNRNDEGKFCADDAEECADATAAIQCAENMSKRSAGAIAFSRSGDPSTGEFEAAQVLQQFGDVPLDHLLRGYDDPELSPEDAAKILDISEALVISRMGIGDLRSRRAGPDRRARLSDVLAFKTKLAAQQRAVQELLKFCEDHGSTEGPRFQAKILHKDYPDDALYITAEIGEEARDSIYYAIEELEWPVDRIEVNEALAPYMPNPVLVSDGESKRLILLIVAKEDT
jgi:hypothetical protein